MAAKRSPPRKTDSPKAQAKTAGAARPQKGRAAAGRGRQGAGAGRPGGKARPATTSGRGRGTKGTRTAARKSPARKAAKRQRPAGVPSHVPHNARPAIKQRAGEAGQEVPMGKEMARAEHEHQDPSNTAGLEQAPAQTMPENYGQFKNKAVARMDKPQNWFRRAAKPKQ